MAEILMHILLILKPGLFMLCFLRVGKNNINTFVFKSWIVILLLKLFKSKLAPQNLSADVPNYTDVSRKPALENLIQLKSKF